MSISEDYWFVVNTKPKQEFTAERSLKSLGVTVYLPLYNKTVKKNKEKVKKLSPLFTGYVFVRFSVKELYHKVRFSRGVKSVLGSDTSLWTIEDEKICRIKDREKDGVVMMSKKAESFCQGDRIRVDEGDFDGWEGVFCEELPDRERAVILLTSVGYSSKLIVPKSYLIASR